MVGIINGTFTLVGALALFLFGMKIMSEGLQRIAGDNFRSMVQKFTSNKYSGLLVGALVTMVIQSSSATTVMVVSFVNSGLLSLTESVGILMGANIGTTVTAWLVTFVGKLSLVKYALIIIALSFPFIFIRGNKARNILEIVAGFAILFMGLGALKNAMPDIESMPVLKEWIVTQADGSLYNRLIFILIGTFITILLQSSSATMALTLTFITENDLPLEIALALVLGENIGTTITAILASLIGNTNAKRASRVHLLFNIIGVTWMFFLLPFFMNLVKNSIVPFMSDLMPNIMSIESNNDLSRWSLTIFHSMFNIINAMILINFVPLLVKIGTKMVKETKKNKHRTVGDIIYFADQIIGSTETALVQIENQIYKFTKLTKKVYKRVIDIFETTDPFKKTDLYVKVKEQEEETDEVGANISLFILRIPENTVSTDDAQRLLLQSEIVQHLEELSDIAKIIGNDLLTLQKQHPYPDYYEDKIRVTNRMYMKLFDYVAKHFLSINSQKDLRIQFEEIKKMDKEFKKHCKKSYREIIKGFKKEEDVNYKATGTVRDIILRVETMSDHLYKIVKLNYEPELLEGDAENE